MKNNTDRMPCWGKFVISAEYGQILAIIEQDESAAEQLVWLITRLPEQRRLETSVGFTSREEAELYLKYLDGAEAQRRLNKIHCVDTTERVEREQISGK